MSNFEKNVELLLYFDRYKDMVETFADNVEYVPGGATLNAIKVAQVDEYSNFISPLFLFLYKLNICFPN